jgi:CspA family cold shock protein
MTSCDEVLEIRADTYDAEPHKFSASFHIHEAQFEAATGPTLHAVVKWFNPEKRFGFVVLPDGSGDAFLHYSLLAQSGVDAVQRGETLEVRIKRGHRGPVVTEILGVDRRLSLPAGTTNEPLVEEMGRVKWFKVERGFGFIIPDRGGKDVFVDSSTLEKSEIPNVAEGQRVIVDIVEGRKGPKAVRIRSV